MHATKLDDHISLIDVETGGFEDFIASYVLKGRSVAIIETGPASSVPNLLSGLEKLSVSFENVAYVAVTHIHLDHAGGVGTLMKSLPNAKAIAHPVAVPHLINPGKLWKASVEVQGEEITDLYLKPCPVPPERIVPVEDGATLDLGNDVGLKVVETLGHASHHQSYYETFNGGLFPGDAAGINLENLGVVVPTMPAPFRYDVAIASLEKLINLNPTSLYYSHFGKANGAVERLRDYGNQLNMWVSTAEEGLRKHEDFETIRSRIFERDPAVRKAINVINMNPILSKTVLDNSPKGAIWYAQKYGIALTK